MSTIAQLFLAFFATIGLICLLWFLFGQLLCPASWQKPLYAVIPIEGDLADLESTIRHLLWLKNSHLAGFHIILLDLGVSDEGKKQLSLLLSQEPTLILTTADQLPQLIEKDG